MRFRFQIVALVALLIGIVACTNDTPVELQSERDMVPVHFSGKPYVDISTRASGNAFENLDEIGIFCVDTAATGCDSLCESGNYADNFRYRFNGESFVPAGSDTIMQYRYNVNAFTYYILYPYQTITETTQCIYAAKEDQRNHANYTTSDLAVQKLTTRDTDITLHLKRMMANIDVHITGSGLLSLHNDMGIRVFGVKRWVIVNLNTQKATTTIGPGGNNVWFEKYVVRDEMVAFHALIAPQQLTNTQQIKLYVDDDEYLIPLPWETVNIPSNYKLTLNLELEEDMSGDVRLLMGGTELQPNSMD